MKLRKKQNKTKFIEVVPKNINNKMQKKGGQIL